MSDSEHSECLADALVTPEWLASNLDEVQSDDPSLRLVEVDLNPEFYDAGHVPGAIGFDWREDLQHHRRRDVPSPSQFEQLLGDRGITDDTTVVVYGDNSNWFAAHFYWLLTYYGHEEVYLLDGGREHWIETDRPLTGEEPSYTAGQYTATGPVEGIRAYAEDVRRAIDRPTELVDVRVPAEFSGAVVTPPGSEEYAQRGGHVPGAVNVVWSANLRSDGRFASRERLAALYRDHGVTDDDDVIVYCRIGERSSLTWFVLSELLDYSSVRNYDGSWVEWGNMIGAPIVADAEDH
jgi:thiosulfate/3-mercaptopyruvate sulfurtransferase